VVVREDVRRIAAEYLVRQLALLALAERGDAGLVRNVAAASRNVSGGGTRWEPAEGLPEVIRFE
jgi:hypothetical protein